MHTMFFFSLVNLLKRFIFVICFAAGRFAHLICHGCCISKVSCFGCYEDELVQNILLTDSMWICDKYTVQLLSKCTRFLLTKNCLTFHDTGIWNYALFLMTRQSLDMLSQVDFVAATFKCIPVHFLWWLSAEELFVVCSPIR